MKIPLCKPSIDEKELNLIKKSIKTGWLTHGPENVKFESNFKFKYWLWIRCKYWSRKF